MTAEDLPEPAALSVVINTHRYMTDWPSQAESWRRDGYDVVALVTVDQFTAERQRAETAEALAETNQFWAEKEHAEGVRLSERLKEAEAVIAPFAAFDTEDFPDTMRLFDDDASLRIEHLRAAAKFLEAKP